MSIALKAELLDSVPLTEVVQPAGLFVFELNVQSDLCKCGEKSDYGCHGIRDGEVYSEFYCKKCHNKRL